MCSPNAPWLSVVQSGFSSVGLIPTGAGPGSAELCGLGWWPTSGWPQASHRPRVLPNELIPSGSGWCVGLTLTRSSRYSGSSQTWPGAQAWTQARDTCNKSLWHVPADAGHGLVLQLPPLWHGELQALTWDHGSGGWLRVTPRLGSGVCVHGLFPERESANQRAQALGLPGAPTYSQSLSLLPGTGVMAQQVPQPECRRTGESRPPLSCSGACMSDPQVAFLADGTG